MPENKNYIDTISVNPLDKSFEVEQGFDLVLQDPQSYKIGRPSPVRDAQQEEGIGYFEALARTTVPARIGAAIGTGYDNWIRALDINDDLQVVDPEFNPVKAFKDGGHSPDEFQFIGAMTNAEQYADYKTIRDWQTEAEARLSESGVTGQAAAFVAQVATDPTTYFGFGAAQMLNKGMATYKAYGLSAAAAGAVYEGIQQSTDIGELRSTADSLITIGAAGVVGGVLGKGVDVLMSRNAGKDFSDISVNFVKDVGGVQQRAKDLSAAAVKNDPEISKVYGRLAYGAAKAYSVLRLSPSVTGQVASEDLSRQVAGQFFERTLLTKGNVEGVPNAPSFIGELDHTTAAYTGRMNSMAREHDNLVKSGVKVDDAIYSEVFDRVRNIEDILDDGTPSAKIANHVREFFSDFSEKLKNVDGFNYRKGYIPSMFDTDVINKNFESFTDVFKKMYVKTRNAVSDDISSLDARLTKLRASGKASEKAIGDLENQLQKAKALASMSDEDLADEAADYALKIATGQINETVLLDPFHGKFMPSQFKERLLEQDDIKDYLVKNPYKLMMSYAREVSPYIASNNALGSRTPSDFIESYSSKMNDKILQAKKSGDAKLEKKLTTEKERIVSSMERGWDDVTGQTQTKFINLTNQSLYNYIKAAKSFTAFSALGNSTLASLPELAATLLVRGFREQAGFVNAMTKFATSPALRAMSKKDTGNIANALSLSLHNKLSNAYVDEISNIAIGGNSASSKVAKKAHYVSHLSMVANGQVPFTSVVRSAIQVAQQGFLRESIDQLARGSLKGERLGDLAKLGIGSRSEAAAIAAQAKLHGETVDGVFFFNTEKWDDKRLAKVVEMAMIRDNRRKSINPNVGDVPHAFRVPGIDLLFQFKSWAVTAGHTYGIASLQKSDASHLMAMSTYIGLSGAAYILSETAKGNEPPTDFDEIMYAGITQSGILGVFPDYGGNYLASTLFDIESGGAKFAEFTDFRAAGLGATYSKLGDVKGLAQPALDAINPDKEAELNNKFWKDFLDVLPLPFVKPYIKNKLLTESD